MHSGQEKLSYFSGAFEDIGPKDALFIYFCKWYLFIYLFIICKYTVKT